MKKIFFISAFLFLSFWAQFASAQTITVTKKAGSSQNKSYSHRSAQKHIYILHFSAVSDTARHWKHASEKINGHFPQDVNSWVMQEINSGKNKGNTLYQNSVYVKWRGNNNKHTIKMSNKPL